MPELPEVESIRLFLEKDLIGKEIAHVKIVREKNFIGNPTDIIGTTITKLDRHGKYLHLLLGNGKCLSIHLRMSGQIFLSKNLPTMTFSRQTPRSGSFDLPNKHTRVIITFTDASTLFYNDLRAFGYLKVENHPKNPMGFDVKNDDIDWQYLEKITKNTKKEIKALLLDQDKIAGIGNIYACEILFSAKINPFKIASKLQKSELMQLSKSIKEVIQLALHHKGTSMGDEMYVLPNNTSGNFQNFVLVYGKENIPCQICQTKIIRKKQNGRSTFYCPNCQK